MADRAQSEVLGFVLVFASIVIAVALVTATGFAGLQGAREAEQVENAAVAFEVLADNVDDLVVAGAPSRSVEIKLADAQLSLAEPVTITVNVTDAATGASLAPLVLEPRPIVYDARSGSTIVYSSGAVIRVDRDGMVTLREPTWLLSSDRVVLPIIQTREASTTSSQYVGGTKRVHVRTTRSLTQLLANETTPQTVTITVTSPRAAAWAQSLDANPDVDCDPPTAESVTCSVDTQRVYVVRLYTNVEFR